MSERYDGSSNVASCLHIFDEPAVDTKGHRLYGNSQFAADKLTVEFKSSVTVDV